MENLALSIRESSNDVYCSLIPQTDEETNLILEATLNPSKRLKDMINLPFMLKHIYIETVNLTNSQTGETNAAPRIILIDDKNNSFSTTSFGVFNALKKIFAIKGTPDTWEKPLKVQVMERQIKERSTLTLAVVSDNKKEG